MHARALLVIAVSTAALFTACKEPDLGGEGRARRRVVKAAIAEFDPNADVSLDAYFGNQRPDAYGVEQAFNQTFEAMDQCVAAYKQGKSKKQLTGDAKFAVKLNPKSSRPLGVNADLPKALASDGKFKDCMREAVAAAPYPVYDGPPVVANFETQVDPGEDQFDD
jgi:hypothetical protein